ncbi:beta strand repeat-containing protein, partial [Vibrio genomosp. F10]|uniref:beta strand repeat-containing protein n=1 Tax=Vibrio genomosp. F10 TaxID=723171 RepID=UPI0013011435
SVEIVLDGDYSEEERVQLAAAERNDVYFLLEERTQNVLVDVIESNDGDALVRSTGSWLAEGFVAGMQIRIAGDSANANDEGTYYEIQSVTKEALTLTTNDLSVEIAVRLDVAAISSSPGLTTIVNSHGKSWTDLGLTVDDIVDVNGDIYQIKRIAQGVLDLDETQGTATAILNAADYRQAVLTKVVIDQREDIDVVLAGTLDAKATNNVYLGSESDMHIGVVSGDNVRIKSKGSLTDGVGNGASVTASSTLILEAGNGAIGSDQNRFTIDLGTDATLTARAKQDIVITEINSDINVATIYSSNGKVDLFASSGSILDALNHEYENIRAQDVVLSADSGTIGRMDNLLDINLTGGLITANALNDIALNETELAMGVEHIASSNGDVKLVAHTAIVDGVADEASEIADIIGASIELIARLDTVGEFGNDLEIDTGSQTGDNLTVTSSENTHLIEMAGDLYLDQVSAGAASIAFIAASNGRILNDRQSGANIISGKAYLFAAKDIGTADNALTTELGGIQGQSTTGNTYVENTGALNIGGVVTGAQNGLLAGGRVHIVTRSPITITENITAVGDINLISTDNSANDDIVISDGVTLSTSASININSGDGFILSQNAVLNAAQAITIQIDQGDIGNNDSEGAAVDIQGSVTAGSQLVISGNTDQDSVTVTGTVKATTINIDTGSDADTIVIDAQSILGDVTIDGGAGNDTITVNQLHTRSGSFTIDGEGGSDQYTINRTGNNAEYLIDVVDSGAANNGADTLTINGLATDDHFLIRANFVAAMHEDGNGGYGSTVERINYDGNINARLTINGLAGKDNFVSDDTSTIVTLDGGADDDTFQIGQLFGSDRQSSLGTVAVGDEIETTETTLGFLSKGNSLPMVIYGGDGHDNIKVYSNKAITKLYGEDGDDSFIVRAFLLKDSGLSNNSVDVELFGGEGEDKIEYSINAALKIDGGAGNDKVVVLGTEGDDNFMITEDGIFGAGLNIGYTGVEDRKSGS